MQSTRLDNYRKVASGKRLPGFVRSARHGVSRPNLAELDYEQLWTLHDSDDKSKGERGNPSRLDLKIELANRILAKCVLCERRCGVDRLHDEMGFCGVGRDSNYFFDDILWGEEPPLVPSHEVFFSGCNMRCSYCYSWESVLDTKYGRPFIPDEFAGIIDSRRSDGATNLNLIGGEPSVHLPSILQALKHTQRRTAVVWNSNFLMSDETMRLLSGIVDLYVGDFRFGNEDCARRLADTHGYFAAAARNFLAAAESGDLIIRHLVIPGHIECCLIPIAQWVADHLPWVPFSIMFQYTPFHRALEDPSLSRTLSPQEELQAREVVSSYKLNTKSWNRPLAHKPENITEH
ncbi:MAG TPA: radical SAM protein, partial [Armatimonadota bacterium]